MACLSPIECILFSFLLLLTIAYIILLIILETKKIKEHEEFKYDDIIINSSSSLNFIDDESIPVYSESTASLGLTGRLILDCVTGICQEKVYYYDIDDDLTYDYVDKLDYSCSEQCSLNGNDECICDDSYKNKGKCSRKYDDKYEIGKYCYADNVIYFWKGKRYTITKKEVYTYYKNSKLKNEECPKGTIDCGIIDDNENKLCISSNLNCPINYFSENKLDEDKIHSSVIIGNKTFYYTFDDSNKRKIIAGLIADSDLYLNENNEEKVLIDTNNISGFLEDNKNLYKEMNLGFDPYKEKDINKRGNSYLRLFYNDNVNLSLLRYNINTYNYNHELNEDVIKPINKKIKLTGIFGFMSIGILFMMIIAVIVCRVDSYGPYGLLLIVFFVFIILTIIFGSINIRKFNKLKDMDPTYDKLPRTINLIIIILIIVLIIYIIFLAIYLVNLRDKWNEKCCSKKSNPNESNITNNAGTTNNMETNGEKPSTIGINK